MANDVAIDVVPDPVTAPFSVMAWLAVKYPASLVNELIAVGLPETLVQATDDARAAVPLTLIGQRSPKLVVSTWSLNELSVVPQPI